ncbi:hypothetical protein J4448_03285 [Candidatus Woesearchaeota archaeon]|nr:hypothetical protein [Candidatus Woesearchaeota archaeon]
MNKEGYEILKAKFIKLFANVPFPLREEIIAVVDNQPFSWTAAYGEIKQDTDKSQIILTHLKQIGLL